MSCKILTLLSEKAIKHYITSVVTDLAASVIICNFSSYEFTNVGCYSISKI